MRYVEARFDNYQREQAYRIYVTKSLQLIPQNSYLQMSYLDALKPQNIDTRSGKDIVEDTMRLAGLRFEE